MTIDEALADVTHLFLDTAPVIYFVEQNPHYLALTERVFSRIDEGLVTAVTSPITLSECLVFPYRFNNTTLQADFFELIVHGLHTQFVLIDQEIARQAAQLRAKYNLALADALQIATAIDQNCEAFLTNDKQLTRVTDIRIIVLENLKNEV
jgi:predicted nucleic acid-binding protein